MNRIYWDKDFISAFTDSPCAKPHKHWLMQLFLCYESSLEIYVNGTAISANCIIVDSDVPHSFNEGGHVYYTMLIDPVTDIAAYARKRYIDNKTGFGIIDINCCEKIGFDEFISDNLLFEYNSFISNFISRIFCNIEKQTLDSRVSEVISILSQAEIAEISVCELAKAVFLSESRLSHLFKENTAIPLKGYILMKKWARAYENMLSGSSITAAAMDAGFDTPSHFSAANKKLTGMTANFTTKNSGFLKVNDD